MGLLDLFKTDKPSVEVTKRALDEAQAPGGEKDAITKLIENILDIGVDGRGPVPSAVQVADKALSKADGNRDKAIGRVTREHVLGGAAGGFVTSLGGFVTMPVALPVNVLEFYLQAARMTAAIAHLRGYDLQEPHIRTAVLLSMVGADADQVLRKAGVAVGAGAVTNVALNRLPRSALMVVNKAIAFRLLRTVGEKSLTRLGRAVPLAGGVVGGGVDGYLMQRISAAAKREFPPVG